MTSRLLIAALLVTATLAIQAAAQEESQEEDLGATISVDVQVVNVLATVRDKQGVLLNSLTKSDFIVEEDGVPQEIRYFTRQADLPLTIGLLVDTSVSQQRVLEVQRSAGFKFYENVLRQKKDLAFLMSFDVDVELLQDLTDSKRLLGDGLQELRVQSSGPRMGPVPQSGRPVGTAMYDSIYLAADEMLRPQVGRKAVVLITDGNDYGSKISLDEAVEYSLRSDVVIYSVRYFDRQFYFRSGAQGMGGASTLKKLARATGGSMYEVTRRQTLDKILDTINEEIRNQYSIGYTPKRDLSVKGFRKIEVKTRGGGHKVQARQGYYPEEF